MSDDNFVERHSTLLEKYNDKFRFIFDSHTLGSPKIKFVTYKTYTIDHGIRYIEFNGGEEGFNHLYTTVGIIGFVEYPGCCAFRILTGASSNYKRIGIGNLLHGLVEDIAIQDRYAGLYATVPSSSFYTAEQELLKKRDWICIEENRGIVNPHTTHKIDTWFKRLSYDYN